ncbi:MAG: tetratricopeptide repeat protein [Myxococcota bacterium]
MAVDRNKVLNAAQKHLSRGNYDRAISEYEKLVAADPRDVRTWLKIGDLHTRKGDARKAAETYHRVAEHYAAQGFFLKAVAVYKQILKLQPERVDVQLRLAEMYENLQLVSDALATYEEIAATHGRHGETEAMLGVLARMADLDPENVPVRIRHAEALSKAGRTQEAAQEFEAGAELLKEQGRTEDYLKVAERLLFHRQDDTELARELAEHYLERNDAKRALAKLQILFQRDPKDVATLELLARAFHLLGQTPKTISVYKEVVRILGERGDEEERARFLSRILELDPKDAEARQALAAYAPRPSSAAPRRPSGPTTDALPVVPPSAVVQQSGELSAPDLLLDEDDSSLLFIDEDDSAILEAASFASSDAIPIEEDVSLVELDPAKSDPAPAPPPLRRGSRRPTTYPGRNRPSTVPPDVARDAQVARLLTEVEVFARYGLRDKVFAQLHQVLELSPNNIEARERLKDAYLDAGLQREAARELLQLAVLFADKPQIAQLYEQQAQELDPSLGAPPGSASQLPPPPGTRIDDDEALFFVDEETSSVDIEAVSARPGARGSVADALGDETDALLDELDAQVPPRAPSGQALTPDEVLAAGFERASTGGWEAELDDIGASEPPPAPLDSEATPEVASVSPPPRRRLAPPPGVFGAIRDRRSAPTSLPPDTRPSAGPASAPPGTLPPDARPTPLASEVPMAPSGRPSPPS